MAWEPEDIAKGHFLGSAIHPWPRPHIQRTGLASRYESCTCVLCLCHHLPRSAALTHDTLVPAGQRLPARTAVGVEAGATTFSFGENTAWLMSLCSAGCPPGLIPFHPRTSQPSPHTPGPPSILGIMQDGWAATPAHTARTCRRYGPSQWPWTPTMHDRATQASRSRAGDPRP